jgi:hypothetical protein
MPSISQNMSEIELIESIYPDIQNNYLNSQFMSERTILSSKHTDVNTLNDLAGQYFPGESKDYLSADSCVRKDQQTLYPVEFLNKIFESGLPLHKLSLKINQPVILMRNLSQAEGLNNGTKLIIRQLRETFIDAEITQGETKVNGI